MFEKQGISLPIHNTVRQARQAPRYCIEVLCILVAFIIMAQLGFTLRHRYVHSLERWLADTPANATLGFGAIYAVSRKGSPRRDSLLHAASLTSLDITIPTQPNWSEEDALSMRAPENSTLTRGSALAWLGHLNALEHFLNSTDDTALILEDDVDWDTRLRSQQMPQIAYAIRELVKSHDGYYGITKSWDILWLGHCGDYFSASRGSTIPAIKSFKDMSMPTFDDLHPWTQEFMHEIGANEDHQRLVHESVHPLCSFAYAISRPAAERLVNELAPQEPVRPLEHPCSAYDVRLLESCRDEGLKCISVNPELFHHIDLGSEIEEASKMTKRDEDVKATENEKLFVDTFTTNIRCSARSRKWNELRARLAQPEVDPDLAVRELAESPGGCYIDGM